MAPRPARPRLSAQHGRRRRRRYRPLRGRQGVRAAACTAQGGSRSLPYSAWAHRVPARGRYQRKNHVSAGRSACPGTCAPRRAPSGSRTARFAGSARRWRPRWLWRAPDQHVVVARRLGALVGRAGGQRDGARGAAAVSVSLSAGAPDQSSKRPRYDNALIRFASHPARCSVWCSSAILRAACTCTATGISLARAAAAHAPTRAPNTGPGRHRPSDRLRLARISHPHTRGAR